MIVQGHVLDALAGLEDESVQCVVTSPPYWQTRAYDGDQETVWTPPGSRECKHDWRAVTTCARGGVNRPDNPPLEGHLEETNLRGEETVTHTCVLCGAWRGPLGLEPSSWLYARHIAWVAWALHRVLSDDGVLWLNIADSYVGKGYDRHEKELALIPEAVILRLCGPHRAPEEPRWIKRADVTWAKGLSLCSYYDGRCKPEPATDRPTRASERVFLLTKQPHYKWNKQGGSEPARTRGWRNLRDVWVIPPNFRGGHPAAFPEELARQCLLCATEPGDTVLDPFCGSGTVGQACLALDRKFIGIDIAESYVRLAIKRLRYEGGQADLTTINRERRD
ncbi:MAG: DNA-methyltransferase [Planctomycetota bacterium]